MSTKEKLQQLKSGKLSAVDNVKQFLKVVKRDNKKLNIFLYIAEKEALKQAQEVDKKLHKKKAGKLVGLCVAVKAVINVKGMPASCGSKVLENYISTYDADVITKIRAEDGIILGIVNCDEFASGISGETSAFGPTINPVAQEIVPGGSSSGSAAAVAAGMCDFSLGSDTGGSIRNPASHCGVVGIKPSYGRVSRYGLIDLSMSLDTIAPCAKDVYGAALLLSVISGKSDSDAITFDKPVKQYEKIIASKKIKIGLSNEFKKLCTNKKIYHLIETTARKIAKSMNSNTKNVALQYTHLGVETYYPIVYTEFYSGTRKLDGRRFGKKFEDGAGEEALRRMIGGKEISRAEHAGQYYRKALATKALIKKDFESAFGKVDVIISPVTPELPHKLGKKLTPEEAYAMDAFTIPASLAGICAGVVPAGKVNGVPVGIQVIAPAFKEDLLCNFLAAIETKHF
jgi:aspartyl-tRNA(Asn)/glutamyl-tRNA(Gln) amidotransferase subunit A